jgi:hypothetical protein
LFACLFVVADKRNAATNNYFRSDRFFYSQQQLKVTQSRDIRTIETFFFTEKNDTFFLSLEQDDSRALPKRLVGRLGRHFFRTDKNSFRHPRARAPERSAL